MKRKQFAVLLLVLLVSLTAFAQRKRGFKPKLGSGTVTGVVVPQEEACGITDLCLKVGRVYYDLGFDGARSKVVTGGDLTPGTRVRVTYKNLTNSEQDVGRLFAGTAVRVVVLGSASSNR